MYKAIVFDAFGTLISTGRGSLDATAELLRLKSRSDITPSVFYSQWKSYHREYIFSCSSFVSEDKAFREALARLYWEYGICGDAYKDADILTDTFGNRKLFPEVKQTLAALKNDYTVCIGSNTDTLPLMQNIVKNGLSVARIYTSESLGVYKPEKEFFEAILRDLNISPLEMLFVGDSLRDDIFGPSQLGITTCHVNRKNTVYTDVIPDISVTSLAHLADILKNS